MSAAFDTRAVLAAVAARIKATVTGVEVGLTPERASSWRLNHPRAALLVDYRGSRYGQLQRMGLVAQPRTVQIGVNVVARTLNDAYGAVALVDAVRAALLGWTPPHCKALAAASDRFVAEEGGLWFYEIVFEAETLAIEDRESAALPVLTRGNADYGFETEDITP